MIALRKKNGSEERKKAYIGRISSNKKKVSAESKPEKKEVGKKKRVLTAEQKERMAEGRKKYLESIHGDDYVPPSASKKHDDGPMIVGYAVEGRDADGKPYTVPVFRIEKSSYKGKIYDTRKEALDKFKDVKK